MTIYSLKSIKEGLSSFITCNKLPNCLCPYSILLNLKGIKYFFTFFSNRNLCSVAVGLLERCILEDPSHEHALLLLSDCLLKTRSGKSWLKTMPDTLNLSSMMNIIPTKMPRANKTEESKQHIQMWVFTRLCNCSMDIRLYLC